MFTAGFRGVVLLVFMVAAVFVVAGSSRVSANVQNVYQVPYPPPPGYDPCQPSGDSNIVQCPGYLSQDPSGCVVLVVTVSSYLGLLSTQYYTLHNLPSSYTINTWVMVTGQLYQGYNYAPSGAACPGNYINVTSMTPL